MFRRMFSKISEVYRRTDKAHLVLILITLSVAGLAHGMNMLHYPYWENDEATYVSQAWSVVTEGKLAPYTYWYDHAPAGWIFMAPWLFFSNLFFGSDSLMPAGRVFMLILHVLSSLALYLITLKLTRSRVAGVVAVLLFSASPLAVYFQRRILLDNIMVFWSLWSMYFALISTRLKHIVLSAILLGIAILSKESAVFLAPVILYIIATRAHKHHKKQAIIQWIGIMGSVVFLYVLMALMKNEFFPSGTPLGGDTEHVSLLETLQFHGSRGNFALPWDQKGDFYQSLLEWSHKDAFIVLAGGLSTIYCLLRGIKNRNFLIIGLVALSFWVFLARGKLVIDFYIVPLVPLLAVAVSATMVDMVNFLQNKRLRVITLTLLCLGVAWHYAAKPATHYVNDETSNQMLAVSWVKQNIPNGAVVSMDDYAYPYLKSNGDYPNADWVWKIEQDPTINRKVGEWQNINYIILTHEVLKQIKQKNFPLTEKALAHSELVADFSDNTTSYIDVNKHISTNGDWVKIYKVKNSTEIALQNSWHFYRENFIHSYGQVIDPRNNTTTSEGQSYAMLRAASYGDKATFDDVWRWTKDHMQHRQSDKLLSWKWAQGATGDYELADSNTASDADIDIAYALLSGYEKWGDSGYREDAMEIIGDIWNHEVREIGGRYVTLSSAENHGSTYRVNPSYFSPYHYRVFAKYDPDHDWLRVAEDSYEIIRELQGRSGAGLLPNWFYMSSTGEIVLSDVPGENTFGYDAFRVNWRLGLDLKHAKSKEASIVLRDINRFYRSQMVSSGTLYAEYDLNGASLVDYPDVAQMAGALIGAHAIGGEIVSEGAKEYLEGAYDNANGYWGSKDNYYNQNWAWFAYDFIVDAK